MEAHLFNELNVVKSSMLKLGSATRESEVLTADFHPILVPLNFYQLRVWNISIPDLQKHIKKTYF